VALVSIGLTTSLASVGRAEPRRSCVQAYDTAQALLERGDLIGARAQLYVCGATSCTEGFQRECVADLEAVEARIPTITLAVQDPAGRDLTKVSVMLDGVPWQSSLDGRELPLNPGSHVLRIAAEGGAPIEVPILAREREKGRIVRATVRAGAPAPPVEARPADEHAASSTSSSSSATDVPLLSFVAGGVGVAALGAFAYFGIAGLGERSDLDVCAPRCPESQRDAARAKLRDADIALAVAVVSFGVAVVAYVLRPQRGPAVRAAVLAW
jgi:hypothetical protein